MPPKKSNIVKKNDKKHSSVKQQVDEDLSDISDDDSTIEENKSNDAFVQNENGDWGDDEENVEDDGEDVDIDDDAGDDDVDEEVDIDDDDNDDGDDDCSYDGMKKSKKKTSGMIDKEDDGDEIDDIHIDENELKTDLYVKPDERRTAPFLFSYERVRILGDRTAQLAQGAKPMIKGVNGMNPRDIAKIELDKKIIPIKIIRPLPNGKKEIWMLDELRYKKEEIK